MIPKSGNRFSDKIMLKQIEQKVPTDMTHKYEMGQNVYYEPTFGNAAARGKYKVVRQLPVENDNRLSYRIKSLAETFERIAEEHQLSRGD
jgi:hypothetical protein